VTIEQVGALMGVTLGLTITAAGVAIAIGIEMLRDEIATRRARRRGGW
jgi:hypothetical protein